jgi:fumarylpyruvate hydrolase
MSAFVIPPPRRTVVPVEGEAAAFPVRRVLCVGRNYAAHRREMGASDDDRDPPFFFSKPADALVTEGEVAYPTLTADLHHEVELVVAIGAEAADVSPDQALGAVFGYAVGVDLTRRDIQAQAKAKSQPWEAAKAFDQSAPISAIKRWQGPAPSGPIRLLVNGQVRQDGRLTDMIWNVAEIVSQASKLWRLAPGDLIFTGTPEGVSALQRGDEVTAEAEGLPGLFFRMV